MFIDSSAKRLTPTYIAILELYSTLSKWLNSCECIFLSHSNSGSQKYWGNS
jgi:hypothetical protein